MSQHGHEHDEQAHDEHAHHEHAHDAPEHGHRHGAAARLGHLLRPHSHEPADKVDTAMEASAAGMRTLWISLAVLAATAALQAAVVAVSGSVALLGDTLHNAADALTAVPLAIAFMAGRRPPTRRYTYGYGRAEDLAGVAIVVIIAASSALTAVAALARLAHPHPVTGLLAVAVAALIGFAGNEIVARYRIGVGRRIGSAALVADGLHARTDGFTSLAVLLGVGGVALGWDWADPVVGLLITVAILAVLRQAAREIWRRLMDAVDPALVDRAERGAARDPRRARHRPGPAALDRPPAPGRVRGHRGRRRHARRGAPGGGQRGARAPARAAAADRRPGARRSRVARGRPSSCGAAGWKRRSRRLLVTTKTEEKAIAAPAIIGLSRPGAASGSAATL